MNQEELDKFEQIPRSEIEFVLIIIFKNLPANKVQDQMASSGNSHQTQAELILILLKFFQKTEEQEYSQLFYDATIILILKPDKDTTKKKTTGQYLW